MAMKVDKLTELKVILKKKQKPEKILNTIFLFLGFKNTEIKLYKLLLNKKLTINQIKKRMNVTERTIRGHINSLLEKQLITRKVVTEGKRLKYVYSSVPIAKAWQIIKKQIDKTMEETNRVFEKMNLLS
ncbi:hypothetical protein DRN74_02590 [Candidatus Micrarchaeota archaeon]|nr:MAG: hypothetical protein DRN74_02590 [Candidatus Micrarchaeota archaeon]